MRGFAEISGGVRYSRDDLMAWLDARGANDDSKTMAAAIFGVGGHFPSTAPAPDFLAVQCMHETGFCTWGGGAKRWNPAGIKLANASGDGVGDFERPASAYQAAMMLYNHWGALLGYDPVPPVHGRFAVARDVYARNGARSNTRTVDDLGGGVWAMDSQYAPKLRKYLQQLEDRVKPKDPVSPVTPKPAPTPVTPKFRFPGNTIWGVAKPYYVAGYNYRRSTSHGVQNLHRGEDVVPTGPDSGRNARYPAGVVGMPIHLISRAKILAVWDRDSVGGYHQAVLMALPDLDVDLLLGHVLAGSMPDVGEDLDVWEVVAKMGTRYDADPQGNGEVDAHIHAQCALSRDRKESLKLGAAFNSVAIDPRRVRLAAGEPDMPRVPYHGPHGPQNASQLSDAMMAAIPRGLPDLLCGDHH